MTKKRSQLMSLWGLACCFAIIGLSSCGGGAEDPQGSSSATGSSDVTVQLAQTHVVPVGGQKWPNSDAAFLRISEGRDVLVLVQLKRISVVAPVLEVRRGDMQISSRALSPPAQLPLTEGGDERFATDRWSVTLPGTEVFQGMSLVVRDGGRELKSAIAVTVAPRTDVTFQILPILLFGASEEQSDLKQMSADQKAQGAAGMPYTTSSFVRHPLDVFKSPHLIVRPNTTHPAGKLTHSDALRNRDNPLLDMVWVINDASGDEALNRVTYGSVYMRDSIGNRSWYGGGVAYTSSGGAIGDPGFGLLWHEGGHAMSLGHSLGEYGSGHYPYQDGSLYGSAWGFDQAQNYFRSTLTTPNSRYKTCEGVDAQRGGRLFVKDARRRCYRFDPMHSADEQKDPRATFPMFSDYNTARMQSWALQRGRVNPGGTGFQRLNAVNGQWEDSSVASATTNFGWDGLNSRYPDPATLNREWDFVFATRSHANTAEVTQFYKPIRHIGNARKTIDPMDTQQLESINASSNKATHYKYCRYSGCDFTVRATYEDPKTLLRTTAYRVLRGSARQLDKPDTWKDEYQNEKSRDSFAWWALKLPVPDGRPVLKKLELLETPKVWTLTAADIRSAPVLANHIED